MTVELKGTVHAIFTEQQVSEKYRKKEMVIAIDTDTDYPQYIPVVAGNQRIDLMNGINMGQKVKATCYLKFRVIIGNYYLNLDLYKIEKI